MNDTTMNTAFSKLSKRQKLFQIACLMFGIQTPELEHSKVKDGPWRTLLRYVLIAAFACGFWYVLYSFAQFVEGFAAGWNSAAEKGDTILTWHISSEWVIGLLIMSWFVTQNYVFKRAFNDAVTRHNTERERANQLEIESTLRLLKAQIEPHFLFNTLGLVQHLAEPTAPQAAALTADLITFLRATAHNLQADKLSLEDDFANCAAYLKIMQTRLPRRLSYDLVCADDLKRIQLPNGLILTLLENAIKHGIERSIHGGAIRIKAIKVLDELIIEVADTGVGFSDTIGHGLGLENIRNRLALTYGGKARLELEENSPSGIIARLVIPVST